MNSQFAFLLCSAEFARIYPIHRRCLPRSSTDDYVHLIYQVRLLQGWYVIMIFTALNSLRRLDRIIDKGTRPKIVNNNVDIPPKVFNDLAASISMGLGFGMVHTIFWYGAIFSTAGGQAAWYRDTCPSINAHAQSAGTAFILSMLHILLSVITLEAYRNINNWRYRLLLFTPFVLYLCHSMANLLNLSSTACPAVIPIQAIVLIVTAVITWFIVYRHDYFANKQMIRWEEAWRTIFSRGLDDYGRLMGSVSADYLGEKRPHSTSVQAVRPGVVRELTRRRTENSS